MNERLLSSEKFIKSVTNISDNLSGKFILPALREAQEIGLRGILGDCLLEKCKQVAPYLDNPDNAAYALLIERAQYYLAYATVAETVQKVSYKVGNFGVAKSSDDNLQVATQDEIAKQQYYYTSKADYYCLDLQNWLLDNRSLFPELTDCACAKIKANLYSAASCGIWLGGPRGKMAPSKPCCKR